MNVQELLDSCEEADKIALEYGYDEGSFPIVIPRKAGGGLRMRVFPGVMGELLCENSSGRAVVRVKSKDVMKMLLKNDLAKKVCWLQCTACDFRLEDGAVTSPEVIHCCYAKEIHIMSKYIVLEEVK